MTDLVCSSVGQAKPIRGVMMPCKEQFSLLGAMLYFSFSRSLIPLKCLPFGFCYLGSEYGGSVFRLFSTRT